MPYTLLNRAKLSVSFLESNAATHHFLFGALAEFLDNSRDANAKNCRIFTEKRDDLRGGYMLCVLDDGEGMDPITAKHLLTFGYSQKRNLDHLIGEYGNGLKSGSMRLGKDFILFTKNNSVNTILFLSRTFLKDEHLEEDVIVPTPSFNAHTGQPWFDINDTNHDQNLQKHKEEMDLIYKYSPFKTFKELYDNFSLIKEDTGTLLIVYNVHVSGNNKPDLDVTTDPKDFLISASVHDNDIEPEKRSFRAYVSILYTDPKMKIYIQGSKVRALRFQYCLYNTYVYKYNAARIFKEKTEKDIKDAENALDKLKLKKIDANSEATEARENISSGPVINPEGNKNARLKQADLASINLQIEQMQKEIDRMKKNKNNPKIIDLIFGLNVRNRSQDGYFIYNGNRLIRMYEKSRKFHQNHEAPGIVAMVDIPFSVLKPGNNKQSFDDENTQKSLLSVFDEHLLQYIKDSQTVVRKDDLRDFWKFMGYEDRESAPSQDLDKRRVRFYKSPIVLQCNNCMKWRMLRLESHLMDKTFSDNWTCEDQTNVPVKHCDAPEEIDSKITEGRLEPKKNEKEEPKELSKKDNNSSSSRSSLMSNSSISKSSINNKQIEERPRVAIRAPSTTSDSEGSIYSNTTNVQRACLSASMLQRASTSETSIQMSASILNPNRSTSNSTRTSLLSTDAQRIVSRAASEIDEEDERRRNNKRISEDVFSNNDDYATNDDAVNNQSDTNEPTPNGIYQQKLNRLHHKKKKTKRHGNVLGLDSSSDDDTDYRPPRHIVSDVNNNSKSGQKDKSSKTNLNSSSGPIVSSVRPVIKEEPEIVQEMDYQPNDITTPLNTSVNANIISDDLRSALQRISDLEKRNADLDAKCKEQERNSSNYNKKIVDLHRKLDEFKQKHECGEKKIKELEKELKDTKVALGIKTDEYKELDQKFATLETSNDVLAENLKLLLENLSDPAESPNKYTHLSIASLVKIDVQDVFNKYRQRVGDQFQVSLDDKCNSFYRRTRNEFSEKLNQRISRARDRCNCGSFDDQN